MILAALVAAVLAALLGYWGTGRVRRWAERGQLLDIPNERSSHAQPTPRGGGLAIAGTVLAGVILWELWQPMAPWSAVLAYVGGAAGVAAISYWDDLRSLSYRLRFAVHFLAAGLVLVAFGFPQVLILPLVGSVEVGWLGLPLALCWIVGLTNAYNFIDGIDGLAGVLAIIAGITWASGAMTGAPVLVGVLGLLVATSSLGFLGHNWPPARIFMGDVGSAFLGFTFAVLPLIAGAVDARWFVAGPIILWPLIADTAFTFLRRLFRRENVFAAHRSHLYQRLIIAHYPHRVVTILYAALTVFTVLLGVAWARQIPGSEPAIVLLLPIIAVALWLLVIREEHIRAAINRQFLTAKPRPSEGNRDGSGFAERVP
jgi:UDP-N-acetylmuramyl pentapeptide phosphotransferase/UDP-N-acetylglucosamine-1-phosphate transferase